MSYLEDLAKLKTAPSITLAGMQTPGMVTLPDNTSAVAMQSRVNLLASHMLKQLKEHETAIAHTNAIFDQLLDDIEIVCECFREAFLQRERPGGHLFAQVDADRSVGILNVLWHTISFTARGNTQPLALFRTGREPVFTGRILALQGDFHDIATECQDEDYPASLIQYELASLYIPADPAAPAVMKVRHLGDEEHYFHQVDAARLFLLKTVEMICSGGFFHEKEY